MLASRHLVLDDFGERFHFTSDHAKTARHRLHGFQWGNELAYSIPRARDDEDIEERVEFPNPGRWHAASEDGCLARASSGRLALQRGAFGAVADDQRPHRDAAVDEQPSSGTAAIAVAAAACWSVARAKAARRRGLAASAASRSPEPHSVTARP